MAVQCFTFRPPHWIASPFDNSIAIPPLLSFVVRFGKTNHQLSAGDVDVHDFFLNHMLTPELISPLSRCPGLDKLEDMSNVRVYFPNECMLLFPISFPSFSFCRISSRQLWYSDCNNCSIPFARNGTFQLDIFLYFIRYATSGNLSPMANNLLSTVPDVTLFLALPIYKKNKC